MAEVDLELSPESFFITEQEWLTGFDVNKMLEYLDSAENNRKLRLFACACCRRIWRSLKNRKSQHAVEVAERYADRLATREDLEQAREAAALVPSGAAAVVVSVTDESDYVAALEVAEGLIRFLAPPKVRSRVRFSVEGMADLVRDIFGNPFRPVRVRPAWVSWNGGMVRKMAQAIYDERRFTELPMLADALEEAGCDNRAVLDHCRGPSGHVPGCWVVDLLQGERRVRCALERDE